MDLSSKLTSNKYKKHLKNNLCLYYSIGNYKLDFYSKKQIIVTPKGYGEVTPLVALHLFNGLSGNNISEIV